jgi:acyl-CoA oxidase
MEEMHHLTSGMKAVYTQMAMDNLLVIRQSVGGAGYLQWSNLPFLIDDFSATVTYEGDNTVMAQQSARFLQKLYKRSK